MEDPSPEETKAIMDFQTNFLDMCHAHFKRENPENTAVISAVFALFLSVCHKIKLTMPNFNELLQNLQHQYKILEEEGAPKYCDGIKTIRIGKTK
jgi:hypothetical protein